MAKSTTALATPLRDHLDRLSSFEPSEDAPVLSLYLDAQPDQHGRDNYDAWLRKTLSDRAATLKGQARHSFDKDVERITRFLAEDARRSANGLAIFACSERGLFDTVQNFDPQTGGGTGFTFDKYSPQALLGTLRWALGVFQDRQAWTQLMRTGMLQDHSWEQSARQYVNVYERAAVAGVWA